MIGVRKSEGAKRMRKNLERYFAERREKKKTGNIRVTYEELLEQAAGNEERKLLEIRTGRVREFQQLLEAFVQEGVLNPVKRSKKPGYMATVYEPVSYTHLEALEGHHYLKMTDIDALPTVDSKRLVTTGGHFAYLKLSLIHIYGIYWD